MLFVGSGMEPSIPLTQQPRDPKEAAGVGPGTPSICSVWALWEGRFSPPCRSSRPPHPPPLPEGCGRGCTVGLTFTLTQEKRLWESEPDFCQSRVQGAAEQSQMYMSVVELPAAMKITWDAKSYVLPKVSRT